MKKALVIDDVEVSRYACSLFLDELAMGCEEASSGKDALSALERESFDVILLDWHLKKTSGLDLIAGIRSTRGGKTAPIIVITGVEPQDKEGKAIQAGAAAYLVKPTSREKLENALRKARVI